MFEVGDRVEVIYDIPEWCGPGTIVRIKNELNAEPIYVVEMDWPIKPYYRVGGFYAGNLKPLKENT